MRSLFWLVRWWDGTWQNWFLIQRVSFYLNRKSKFNAVNRLKWISVFLFNALRAFTAHILVSLRVWMGGWTFFICAIAIPHACLRDELVSVIVSFVFCFEHLVLNALKMVKYLFFYRFYHDYNATICIVDVCKDSCPTPNLHSWPKHDCDKQ